MTIPPRGFVPESQQPQAPRRPASTPWPTPGPATGPRREPTNEEIAWAERQAAMVPSAPVQPSAGAARAGRPRRLRPAAVAAAAVLGATAFVVGGLATGGPQGESHVSWSESGVTTVVVDGAIGDVTIVESPDDQVHYSEDVTYRGSAPQTQHRREGSTLHVDLGGMSGRSITAGDGTRHYRFEIPPGADVVYTQDAGELDLSGSFGSVRVASAAGRVEAHGLTAASLELTVSAGDVKLAGLRAPTLRLEQAAGDAEVEFVEAPTDVRVTLSAGEVDLRVPDATYEVTKSVRAGSVEVSVPTGSSDHDIAVDVSVGDVRIQRR